MALVRPNLIALLLLVISAAGNAQPAKDANPWGEPADGIACRLTLKPEYVTGQTISAVLEIKNASDKKRFLVPRLEPLAIEHLVVEIIGPMGKVKQVGYSRGYSLTEASYKPIQPGETIRRDVIDLRDYFGDLLPGKYTARFRFRSPKPPTKPVEKIVDGGKPPTFSSEVISGAWAKEAAAAPVAFTVEALAKDDLIVHEWGVFTVFNDARFANVNRKQEWGDLPNFFYRQFPTERLRWVPSAWDKPIVYFYAKPTPLKVKVKVTFAEGAPVIWWPAVASPVDDPYARVKTPRPFRSLVWEAWLGDAIPPRDNRYGPLTKVEDFPLPADCWLKHARLPGATQLTVIGNVTADKVKVIFPGSKDRLETERFLYYDGLVPAPSYLRCEKIDAASLVMRNSAEFDIGPLFLVDRRVKDRVGFAFLDGKKKVLEAGTSSRIELQAVPVQDWPAVGAKQVRQSLLNAGLFAPEADALLQIWDKQFLHSGGVTAFHILPPSEYDRMLPLEIRPEPRVRPTRVAIALHPHIEIEPDLAESVAKLIRDLGSAQFEKRAAADKALKEIGPLAIAMLRAELKKEIPLEAARRIQGLLDRFDAANWLGLPMTKAK